MPGLLTGWKPALRIARRDALRSKGRSILVLVMIALPVLAVSAADVVYKTQDVNGVESLDQRLGTVADARIRLDPRTRTVAQWPDPDIQGYNSQGRSRAGDPLTVDAVRDVLGRDVDSTEVVTNGYTDVDTGRGVASVTVSELDPASPLAAGLFRLTAGSWPSSPDEVTVNAALAEKGFSVGSDLTLHGDGGTFTVSGIAESATYKGSPTLMGTPGALGDVTGDDSTTLLIDGGPVSWSEVRALNAIGAVVLSRSVVEHPPPDSQVSAELTQYSSPTDDAYIAALVLIVVMALLEVVLLAGPAFAVGARRQSRTLALMAATGGTPRQARRVILASGLVLGAAASVLGVALGLAVGWAVLPIVQHYSDAWLGPFEVAPLHLLGVAGFGLLSAFLAAVVPAWIASRQDVVAVLAGRRGDRRPGYRSPLLGAVLLGIGIAMSVVGARGGEVMIAAAAVVSVIGMILLVPVVVVLLAMFSRRLPLVTRYAVRDAARHRTRTVPAVAAVAATVAGVVALGIANASDAAESEATYRPTMTTGAGMLVVAEQDVDWAPYEQAVAREAPSATATEVRSYGSSNQQTYYDVRVHPPGTRGYESLITNYTENFGAVLTGATALDMVTPTDPADLGPARRMLADGGLVVFTSEPNDGDRIRVNGSVNTFNGDKPTKLVPLELPAYFLQVKGMAPARAVAPPGALDATGLREGIGGLLLDASRMSTTEEDHLREAVQGLNLNAFLYVERGFRKDNATLILLGILFGLGAVLMLGGTLTATFLALSDARPDLATLSAVGAAPRTRRGVAAAYALVVGFLGALLGAAVGFIPGIAITYPLTTMSVSPGQLDQFGNPLPTHFIDVPWLYVLGLVVVLPLLTALIVGLTARSRLPLVARLD